MTDITLDQLYMNTLIASGWLLNTCHYIPMLVYLMAREMIERRRDEKQVI